MAEAVFSRPKAVFQLLGLFIVWKVTLLAVILLTPVAHEGYDSSTQLFFDNAANVPSRWPGDDSAKPESPWSPGTKNYWSRKLAGRLTRWDGIYFTSAASRGYVNEQDWAFSYGYTRLIRFASKFLPEHDNFVISSALIGIAITNLCHVLSAFVLNKTVGLIARPQVAFVAAALHILSPAGVFLVAPYSEAPYALLSFVGTYLYSRAAIERARSGPSVIKDTLVILSGAAFGLATTVRGNGLLNGIIFAIDASVWALGIARRVIHLPAPVDKLQRSIDTPRLWTTILAGSCIAIGYSIPQYVAYHQFCDGQPAADQAAWCSNTPPSIYSYIQSKYWKVGFFRYWTLSNIPLFLLAGPMLWMLIISSVTYISKAASASGMEKQHATRTVSKSVFDGLVMKLALPQLVLALITLTTAHVQIVNRLASGYPLWNLFLSQWITSEDEADRARGKRIFKLMVTYAVVQAALFAAFLPPA